MLDIRAVLEGEPVRIISEIESVAFRWRVACGEFGTYNLAVDIPRVPESVRRSTKEISPCRMSREASSPTITQGPLVFALDVRPEYIMTYVVDSLQPR